MTSTIDRTQPPTNGPLVSADIRNGIGNAAADDIEALQADLLTVKSAERRTIVYIGDSFTEQNEWITDSTGIYVGPKGYIWWTDYYTGGRLDVVRGTTGADGIIGTGGDSTTDILANLTNVAIPMQPGYIVIQSASNDPIDFPGDSSLSIANYQAMMAACQAAGIYLILTTWCSTSASDATTAIHQDTVNQWLRSQQAPGVAIADTARMYIDPDAAFPSPLAAYTADGNHPNTIGAARIARSIADVINQTVPPRQFFPDNFFTGATGPTAVVTNPLMLGTGGNVTDPEASGDLANDFMGAGRPTSIVTLSKVARTDGIAGEWQRCVVATTGYSNPQVDFGRVNLATNTPLPAGLVVGDWVSLVIELAPQDGATGRAAPANPRLRFIGAPAGEWVRHMYYTGAADVALDAGDVGPGVLRTPPYQVPAGVTTLNVYVDLPAVGDGSFTTDIGRVALVAVP